MITLNIDPEKIRDVIGKGGETIKGIVDETGVKIDIEDDGTVFVAADDQESGQEAKRIIERLTEDVEVGNMYMGEVKKTVDFGAFVEILPGKEGLVHISELADRHVKNTEDILKQGEEVLVKVIDINDRGVSLSRKEALADKEENK